MEDCHTTKTDLDNTSAQTTDCTVDLGLVKSSAPSLKEKKMEPVDVINPETVAMDKEASGQLDVESASISSAPNNLDSNVTLKSVQEVEVEEIKLKSDNAASLLSADTMKVDESASKGGSQNDNSSTPLMNDAILTAQDPAVQVSGTTMETNQCDGESDVSAANTKNNSVPTESINSTTGLDAQSDCSEGLKSEDHDDRISKSDGVDNSSQEVKLVHMEISDGPPEPAKMMEYRGDMKTPGAGDGDSGCSSSSEDSSSSSSSSDETDSSDDEAEKEREAALEREKNKKNEVEKVKTKGELLVEDLPPIEELTISVEDDVELVQVGQVTSVVGTLVIIQAEKDKPALNDDTILLTEERKPLGRVFEVFGPVVCPFYSVRFNSSADITEKDIKAGMSVFYAPDKPEFTNYVFVEQLKQIKGSDASWEHNNEPPSRYMEYSDDEQERRSRRKARGKDHPEDADEDEDGDSQNKKRKQRKWKNKNRPENNGYGNNDGYQGPAHSRNTHDGPLTCWPPSGHRSTQHYSRGNWRGMNSQRPQQFPPPTPPRQQFPPSSPQYTAAWKNPPSHGIPPQPHHSQPQHNQHGMQPPHIHPGMNPGNQHYSAPPPHEQHSMPPQNQQHGMPPQNQHHGIPPQNQHHGMPPHNQHHGMPPNNQHHGMPPQNPHHGMPPQIQHHGMPPSNQQHGAPPPNLLHGMPPQNQFPPRLQHGGGYGPSGPPTNLPPPVMDMRFMNGNRDPAMQQNPMGFQSPRFGGQPAFQPGPPMW